MPLFGFTKRLRVQSIERLLARIVRGLERLARLMCLRVLVFSERARHRHILLFHLALAGQVDYIKPVLLSLRSRAINLSIYLVVNEELRSSRQDLAALTGTATVRILRWNEQAALGTVDAFVTPTQWLVNQPNAIWRVCIFHGQPTKGITFLPELMRNFNVLFLLGPLQRTLYEDFAVKHPEVASQTHVFEIGFPKSDALLLGVVSREQVLARLGLNSAAPVVLYAPAWDKGTALDLYGEEVIEKLLETGASVVVKLHYMCYDPNYCSVNWTERLQRFQANPRFRHAGNQLIDPFLAASDVLVTDISSASFEFMMLDKPVVFIDCPSFFKATLGHGQYIRPGEDVLNDIRANAGRSAGLVVHEISRLPAAIARSLKCPEEFSSRRQAVRSQLLYNAGRASEAAAQALLGLLAQSRAH